jgi:hypothetical protein
MDFATTASFVVLTGVAPAMVGSNPIEGIQINGSVRGVSWDAARERWSYLGPLNSGSNEFIVSPQVPGSSLSVSINVELTLDPQHESADSFGPGIHFVGSWFFSWFVNDNWQNRSPWWPVGGFQTWTGTVEWAKNQLLDAMDANIDFLGIQFDSKSTYRFQNAVNVLQAARELVEEGYQPPRLALFQDTAIINQLYKQRTGSDLDVGTDAGRAEFFSFTEAFYEKVHELVGDRYENAVMARYNDAPIIAFWHSAAGSIQNASEFFVLDQKSRFAGLYGTTPYFVAHPIHWSGYPSTDEITLMFGPSTHFHQSGRDGAGKQTINITPGFWNPLTNPHYLARQGGVNYVAAWETALTQRDDVEHIYIDSWNETGEGSGIFEAQTFTYTTADRGLLGDWQYTHDESWGPTPRHYIDLTAQYADQWNDTPANDARWIADDLPAQLNAGERRLATVVLLNAGDRAWNPDDGDRLDIIRGIELVPDGPVAIENALDQIDAFGGVFRGKPRTFTFEVVAPFRSGTYDLAVQMRLGENGATFGSLVEFTLEVIPLVTEIEPAVWNGFE